MSRYLLDTTTLIDFSKNRGAVYSWMLQAIDAGDQLGVSPITIAEFYAGVEPANRPIWDELFVEFEFWPVSRQAARQAGAWRFHFDRQGQPLTIADLLTAAVAYEQQATLVTRNVRDFPMSEVQILAIPSG